MENVVFKCKVIKKMSDEALITKLNEFRNMFDNAPSVVRIATTIDIDITANTDTSLQLIENEVIQYGINNRTAMLYQGIRFFIDKLSRGEEINPIRVDWAIPCPMANRTDAYQISYYPGMKAVNLLVAIGNAFADPKMICNNKRNAAVAGVHAIFTCIFDNTNQFIEYVKANPLLDMKVTLNTYQSLRFNKMLRRDEFTKFHAEAFNTILYTSYIMQDQLPSIEDFKKAVEYAKSYTTVSEVLKAWRKKHKQLLSCYIGEDEKQYLEYMLLSNTVNYEKLKEFLYSGKKGE